MLIKKKKIVLGKYIKCFYLHKMWDKNKNAKLKTTIKANQAF